MENKIILNLVDTALKGDSKAAQLVVRKLASKVRTENSDLYAQLLERMNVDALRGGVVSNIPLPVDMDSRQELVKVESPVVLEQHPIHTDEISKIFEQVFLERRHIDELLSEGLEPTRSIILQGPPGVGKTMSARWLASEMKLPLLTLDLATVMSSFLGKTGSNVRAVLEHAMSFPCVLLLDEFDAIAKRRDDDRELGELKRLVTVLLQAIDEWPSSSLLIAATNHEELLDPAIWRRFDLEVSFEKPSPVMVRKYLEAYWPDITNFESTTEKFKEYSFSKIDRELRREKRQAVISGLGKSLSSESTINFHEMSMDEKKSWVVRLSKEGFSQRAIAQRVGISRPTVKKALDQSE